MSGVRGFLSNIISLFTSAKDLQMISASYQTDIPLVLSRNTRFKGFGEPALTMCEIELFPIISATLELTIRPNHSPRSRKHLHSTFFDQCYVHKTPGFTPFLALP